MSKPRYRWWGYVKNVIRAYPELKKAALGQPSVSLIAKYGPTIPSGGGEGRPVESVAVKRLTNDDAREYEAVRKAVQDEEKRSDASAKLKIIELVYWKRSHTLWGAGREVGYSYRQTRRMHEQFIHAVAANLGLKEKKMAPKSQNSVSE